MIPKVIYKTGPFREIDLPQEIKNIFNDTIEKNPDHKLVYFDDKQCEEFIIKNFDNKVLETYRCLIPSAYKADFFRYCILYKKGGIWSDLTQKFIEPINGFIDFEKDELVLVEGAYIGCVKFRGIEIAFMASKPKNEIYLKAIEQIKKNVESNYYGCNSFDPTGPTMFRKLVKFNNTQYKLGFDFRRFGDSDGTGDFIFYNNEAVIKTRSNNHAEYLYYETNKPHYSQLHRNKKIYKK